jgi:anti-sigma-K factor RskA
MSHPEHQSPQDLAAAYALDALTPEEARQFEAFLVTSPEAQREVAEFRDVAALLALAGSEGAAGPDLRERVLGRIGEEKTRQIPFSPSRSSRSRTSPAVWGTLAASLIAAVGLGAAFLSLKGDVSRLERTLAERQQQLTAREATLNAILEPGVELYQLTASGDPDPGIQLFWDRARNRAIIHGFRLKPVPTGRAYQLWFIKDGKPVPSVTFKPESTGYAKVEQVPVPADGKVSAAAITVEPEGGSPQPTSPILLVGTLQKS